MTLPELKPIKFRLYDVQRTLDQFRKGAEEYSKTFLDISDIEKDVDTFISSNPKIGRLLRVQDLAAQRIHFELIPLVAKFSGELKFIPHESKLVEEFSHVAIRPRDAVEGGYYHYELIIPIREDMLDLETEEELLKAHVSLIDGFIDQEFRKNVIELKPLDIVTRMYGWQGSWITYSISVKDDPDVVWSTPLVDAPYKDTQPYLAVKGGEFLILEDDRYKQSTRLLRDVRKRLIRRTEDYKDFQLKEHEMIRVNSEWVLAHAIKTGDISRSYSFERMETAFGKSIPQLTIYDKDLKGPDLINKMIEIMYEPTYRFDIENIRNFTIISPKGPGKYV